MTEYITVGSLRIEIQYEAAALAGPVSSVRRYLHAGGHDLRTDETAAPAAAGLSGGGIRLRLHAEEQAPTDDAEVLGEFTNGFSLLREGSAVLLAGRGCLSRLDVEDGRGEVWAPSSRATRGRTDWTLCVLILESLILLLRRYRLYGLHAAALSRDGRGLVFSAAADSGKSTLAFRLVQSGWDYLSDDTVLLHPTPAHVEVRGLRSHFSLDPGSDEVFPEVVRGLEAALLKEDKWAVNVETIYPDQRIAACVPHGLVFPQIVDAAESEVVAISGVEALRLLIEQSSLARVNLPGSGEHFAALARLVREVPTYRLRSGRDLLKDSTRANGLLEPLLTP